MLPPICEGYEKGESGTGPCIRYLKGGFCTLPMIFRCTEFIRNNEPTLSYSSMKDFVCPRKFYHSYIQGLEPVDKALPLLMGSVADSLLQMIHGENSTVDLPSFFSQFKNPVDEDEDFKPWLYAMWGLFQGYISKHYGDTKGSVQVPFEWFHPGYPRIRGFADLVSSYEDHIAYEFKYTGRPDSYTKFSISQQLGTYFLGIPQLQRITLRAIQVPQLKQSSKESGEQYRDRVYLDFCGRPGYYIHDSHYWRTEFDLEAIKERARRITRTIHSFCNEGIAGFYQNIGPETCFAANGRCNYLSICESGVISETIYRKREVK